MFKLLDRFAWILSITLWLSLAIYIDNDLFLWWIIFWIIFKFIFLSRSFIEQRVEFFWDALLKKGNISIKKTKTKLDIEVETIKQDLPELNNTKIEKHFDSTIDIIKEKIDEKEPSMISKFFSENLLAKLWGILIFLWVLFFLSLIYNSVWPVA